MHRRKFLEKSSVLALLQLTGMGTLSSLDALGRELSPSERMPAMFVGHGNPMNAIENNIFHQTWQRIGKELPRPKAILSVSAHWLTKETSVTVKEKPQTIHDFGGFPKQLFDQEYPAPGSPEYARMTQEIVTASHIQSDEKWGLDHGTWSVLAPMFPLADIPVFQLSLVYEKPSEYHYQLGQQLAKLRDKGVLIMGSGNIVHNLAKVDWEGTGKTYDWAQEFDNQIKTWIDAGDHQSIMDYQKKLGKLADLAHPTNDHFLPLFYILGMQQKNEKITYFNDRFDMGSIAMRSFLVGQ